MRNVSVLECFDDILKQVCLFVAMNVEESRSGLESEDSSARTDALKKCVDLERLILLCYSILKRECDFMKHKVLAPSSNGLIID